MVSADALGQRIVWIVPKQATFQTQRLLALDPRLTGYCNVRVTSFDQLANETLIEVGGVGGEAVTPLGRQMVIGHLLRRHEAELTFFRAAARQPGLAAEIDKAFAQFEQAGKDLSDPAPLFEAAGAFGGGSSLDEALRAKLTDLQTLHRAYRSYLGEHHVDPSARMMLVPRLIEQAKSLQGTDVFVDEFYEFTGLERLMLIALAKTAAEVNVTLCLDPDHPVVADPRAMPDEMSLFHRTAKCYQRLRAGFTEERVPLRLSVLLAPGRRFRGGGVALLERQLISPGTGAQPPDGVKFVRAPGVRGQIEAAARQIKAHLAAGLRLRDIVVLVRSVEGYAELLDAGFAEHDIPYFIDRRRTAAHHPLIRAVRSIMQIALHRWPTDAVVALAKTGLSGINDDDADLLEDYMVQHRITPDGWANEASWQFRRELASDDADDAAVRLFDADDLSRVDAARTTLREALSHLVTRAWAPSETITIRQRVLDLYQALTRLGAPDALLARMNEAGAADDRETRDEHRQVWDNFTALLDQLVDLLGDEPAGGQTFAAVLDVGLESFDLAITPPTVDQVLVGVVDRTRTPPVKAVIVLGLNEGEFPLTHHEDSVLSDRDRRLLTARGIDVEVDSERRQLDEQFLGYIAFTRASEFLTLVHSSADDGGNALNASSLWLAAQRIFDLTLSNEVVECCHAVSTPRQLVTELLRWAHRSSARDDDPMRAIYDGLVRHTRDDALRHTRDRAWPSLAYENRPELSPAVARQLFKAPLCASVSRLESFTRCPFQHFVRYGLALQQRPEDDVTQIDLGTVYHAILDNLIRKIILDEIDFAHPETLTPHAIAEATQKIAEQLRGQIMLSSARNRYLLTRVKATIQRLLEGQQELSRAGALRPRYTELTYGLPSAPLGPLVLRTPRGAAVHLRGKIDRVDVTDCGVAIVIDYKLGSRALGLDDVYYGLSLQLLSYLLVLRSMGHTIDGKSLVPAAAFYVKLMRAIETINDPTDAPEPGSYEFNLKTPPRGVISRVHLPVIDPDLRAGGRSQFVSAAITKTGELYENCDAVESDDFNRLLDHVERQLGATADQILAGRIAPAPYMMGKVSPCPQCNARPVCRFDLANDSNSYQQLTPLKRSEVLERLRAEAGDE